MNLVKSLTPQHTEKIKPGLFIQKYAGGYRQIQPAAWNGKINWKVVLLGTNFWKNLFIFITIMLIAFGYYQGTHSCEEFQKDPCKHLNNITQYCFEKQMLEYNFVGGDTIGDENFNAVQALP